MQVLPARSGTVGNRHASSSSAAGLASFPLSTEGGTSVSSSSVGNAGLASSPGSDGLVPSPPSSTGGFTGLRSTGGVSSLIGVQVGVRPVSLAKGKAPNSCR
jgi:hypothetical protein